MAKKTNREINGNVSGIKKSLLIALSSLYDCKSTGFCDQKILDAIAMATANTGREISVLINRKGFVTDISMGTGNRTDIPVLANDIRDPMRSLHTHPGGSFQLSELDKTAYAQSALDAMAAVGVDDAGNITGSEIIYTTGGKLETFICGDLVDSAALDVIFKAKKPKKESSQLNKREHEHALVVGVDMEKDANVEELTQLAATAGAKVVAKVTQARTRPDKSTFVGSGKLTEIKEICQIKEIDLVIFDNELSGIQIRNLEDTLGVKVIDRSMLILDIFAGRAKSVEGKLQVELAQLKYNRSRLIGIGGKMDKMRSGIGMRGPGEKKLEIDRRNIHERIVELELKIEKLKQERDLRRSKRLTGFVKTVALVGYTNAGKSTIMNVLAKSDVFAEDMLFATLDPVTRKVYAGENMMYYLTDTVGFIDKLPHEFIDAFRSTLEEARQADILLHIVDCANPEHPEQMKVVDEVLSKLDIVEKDIIIVYNKADKLSGGGEDRSAYMGSNCALISAKTGDGVTELKRKIALRLFPEAADKEADREESIE